MTLTWDHLCKHKLLGGTGGRHGTAVPVLIGNRARRGPERVANAPPPEVEAVDANHPARSGLQDRLTAEGFALHWVREENDDGRRVTFRVPRGMPSVDPSALVLMKRRN